jgi:hypothetical protein
MSEPKPCPVCGRKATMRSEFLFARDIGTRYSHYRFTVICSRMYGLLPCVEGSSVQIEKDWADVGERSAIECWNREAKAP